MNPTEERTALMLVVLTASVVYIAVAAARAIIVDIHTIIVKLATIIYHCRGRSRTR